MKFKTTKLFMKDNYNYIISMNYCNAQSLLSRIEPIAYSTRVEGWACDYYEIDLVLISTGYAPIAARNTHSTYDIVRRYDDQAQTIATDIKLNYNEQTAQIDALLHQYIEEVTQ